MLLVSPEKGLIIKSNYSFESSVFILFSKYMGIFFEIYTGQIFDVHYVDLFFHYTNPNLLTKYIS